MSEIKRVIALGFFDGVHIGHAELLNKAKERAVEYKALPSVLTFDVHPDTLVFNKEVALINSQECRKDIISRYFGIDDVIFLHFNQKLMHMPWKEFIDSLITELNICAVVVGHDFTFGFRGEGNAEKLNEYCTGRGIGCDVIPPVYLDDVIVSSTYIRSLLLDGQIETANKFLGHPHVLKDVVHSGFHLGSQIGSPTINMFFPEGVLVPRKGVYATKVYLSDGSTHYSTTNIGVRPTFDMGNKVSVETNILKYCDNLYGKYVRLEFYHFIRDEIKFNSIDDLKTQIQYDIAETEAYFTDSGE